MIWWWNVYDMVIKMFMTWWGNVQMINDMVSQGRNIFAKSNPSIHASISTLNHFWSYWSSYSIIINHTHLDNFYIHIHILLAMLILITLIRLLTLHWSSFLSGLRALQSTLDRHSWAEPSPQTLMIMFMNLPALLCRSGWLRWKSWLDYDDFDNRDWSGSLPPLCVEPSLDPDQPSLPGTHHLPSEQALQVGNSCPCPDARSHIHRPFEQALPLSCIVWKLILFII